MIVTIDCLRADHVGALGGAKNLTPFLDSLFAKGVVFEQAVSPSYLTWFVNGSILTSLFPSQNNLSNVGAPIDAHIESLPKILGYYGYQSAAFLSRAHAEELEFGKLFDRTKLYQQKNNLEESSRDVLAELAKSGGPRFVYWTIYDVHKPYDDPGPDRWAGSFRSDFQRHEAWNWEGQTSAFVPARRGPGRKAITPQDTDYLRAAYDAGVARVDAGLRRFFDEAGRRGLDHGTLFVITAEHGEDQKEHGFFFHRDLYDVNIHVPLAFIGPGYAPARIAAPVSLLDIMPTILARLDVPVPSDAEGRDLSEVIKGPARERRIFSERPPFEENAVREGRYKYILRNPAKTSLRLGPDAEFMKFFADIAASDLDHGDELYDLASDALERRNLIGTDLPVEAGLRAAATAFRDRMLRAHAAALRPAAKPKAAFSYP